MSGALDGILVLDLTRAFWSSLGCAVLADFGAEVIKIEPLPEAREHRREGQDQPLGSWSPHFELANRNKMSLAVLLRSEPGREIVHQLVRRADAFVTDEPLPSLQAQGLDYQTLAGLKPDLIYARGSGFGPHGPDRDLPALDELAAARTGLMPILPQPGQPPVYPGHGQMYATIMLAFGVAVALQHRRRTGEGQQVDVSLLGANMYGASLDLQAYLAIGGEQFLHPLSRFDFGNPMGNLYQTQDGRWVTLTMPDTDRWWPAFSQMVGLDVDDPRFDTHEKRCETNRLELIRLLDEAFEKHPAEHWRREFTERQMSADIIEDYSFPASDDNARRNRYILEMRHPSLGPVKSIGFPIFMSGTPARLRRNAPCLGQHSAQILHDLLGYPEDRIVELAAAGVIA